MPAATVIVNNNQLKVDIQGGHTDQRENSNLLAMTGNGRLGGVSVYAVTINPSSLIDGAGETQQVTGCTGVVLGKTTILGIVNPIDLQDITVTAYVQANGVIEFRFQNEGAATVDLASAVWYIVTAHLSV